jgi:LysM repeat protein
MVVIPNGTMPKDFDVLVMNQSKSADVKINETKTSATINNASASNKKVEAETNKFHINGVPVIKALPNENVSSISKRIGIDASKFIDYNDIAIDARIIAGNYYFIKLKKKKGAVSVYQTQTGDNLWAISQQQGIRLSRLKKLNPNIDDQLLASGIIVRLNNNKAIEENQPVNNDEVVELSDETFAWGASSDRRNVQTSPTVNLESIDNDNKVSVDSFKVAKPILPDTTKSDTDTIIIYEVKSSDTLYGIARQFDATIKDIMEWNNKTSFSISVGEKLKIKKR